MRHAPLCRQRSTALLLTGALLAPAAQAQTKVWSEGYQVPAPPPVRPPAPSAPAAPPPEPRARTFAAGDVVEVSWKGKWYLASILEVGEGRYKVHYAGFDASWDEWVPPQRIRAAPEGARLAQPTPTGRFVCLALVAGQLQPQGEFVVHADGTYRDTWNKKDGRWTFDPGTRAVHFTGVLANGARATYVPDTRQGMIVFDWGNGVRRDCYR